MLEPSRVIMFALAATAVTAAPGPNHIYIVTRGIVQGRRAAVLSALGVESADLIHIGAAAAGVSALIASSEVAFTMLRYLGAAYLVYLGVRALQRGKGLDVGAATPASLARVYWQGFVVNALNPKVALFFLAFLPQFVDAGRGSVPQQVVLLGAIYVLVGVVFDMGYALVSGSLGLWLSRKASYLSAQRYVSAAVYIGLGLWAILYGAGTH